MVGTLRYEHNGYTEMYREEAEETKSNGNRPKGLLRECLLGMKDTSAF